MRKLALSSALAAALTACLGTTGNTVVRFQAAAAGPADAVAGAPFEFTSGLGWHVVLTKATLHVGALYLVETLPSSGGGPSPCFLPGTYVAEVTTNPDATAGIDVDILSPTPQLFPTSGEGINLAAKAAQVWLTGVQVDQINDPTTILHVEGTADKDGKSFPFTGNITIGKNRLKKPTDSTKPGSDPICKQRIVSPILVDFVPKNGGTLLLRIDPRRLFVDIDFSMLKQFSANPPQYGFVDKSDDEPSALLYQALRGAGPLYQLSWEASP